MALGDTINTGTLTMTFDDEFNSFSSSSDGSTGTWDTSLINGIRTLGGNGEEEYYSDSSVGVNPFSDTGGVLNITAAPATTVNADNLPYTSGAITTEDSFSQLYGYFEIDAKLPAGQGLWPAFWLLPSSGAWPPELDVFEVLENDPSTVYFTTHSGVEATNSQALSTVNTSSGYNLYGVMWGPQTIELYINNVEVAEAPTPADMDVPMYMLANLAVGGYWPGDPNSSTSFPATMSIDYIRAYAYPGTTGGTLDVSSAPTGIAETAPVISLNSTAAAATGAFTPLTGMSISSETGGRFTIALSASDGLLATPSEPEVYTTGEGTDNLTLIGDLTQINKALAGLSYERTTSGTDWLWVSATDPAGLSTTSYITVSTATGTTAAASTMPMLTASSSESLAVGADSLLTGLGITDGVATDYINLTISAGTGTFTDTADSGATVAGNESTSITFTGTAGALDMELEQLYYQAGTATGADTLQITAIDSTGGTATSHVTLSIKPGGSITTATSVSTGTTTTTSTISTGTTTTTGSTTTASTGTTSTIPAATPTVATPATLALTTGASSAVSGVTVSDSGATGEFTVMVSDSTGTLSASATTGVILSGDHSTALTLTGSLAAIDTDLASLIYQSGTSGTDYLWVSADNASGKQGLSDVVVSITNAATSSSSTVPPVVVTTASVNTTTGSDISLSGTSITDTSAIGIFSITVSDTSGKLSVSAASGVTITGEGTDDLKLTGSLAAINADLAGLKYQAGTATGTDWVWVSADNASGNQGIGHEVVTLTAPVVTLPVVTVASGPTIAAGATTVLSGVTVSDAKATGTFTVTVSDSSGLLSAGTVSGVALTGNGTDDLELTGSLAAIDTDLATLKYKAGASAGTDYVWISADDASGNQGLNHEVVTITPSVPVVTSPSTLSIKAGASQKLTGISVADNLSSGTFSVAVSDTLGKLTLSSASGVTVQGEDTNVLKLTGSLTAINADLAKLTYLAGTSAGTDYLWISADDANGNQGISHEVVNIAAAIATASTVVSSGVLASDIASASTVGFISSASSTGYTESTISGSTGTEYSFSGASQTAASSVDLISNFQAGIDILNFVGLDVKLALQGSVPSGGALTADSIGYQQSGSNMLVYVNETSSAETLANANLKIQLTGVTGLSASNFLHL